MANLLLAIIYLAFISLGLPDGLLGAAWPSMYPQFHVSVDLAGYVSMVISAGTIISALLSDRATLRFGAGKVTAASVTLTMIALFGFSFSTQYWMLLLWAIPYGLGAGGVDAALNNYVALHYASRHMSWLHCMWGLGATVGPAIIGYTLSAHQGWQRGYQIVAILQLVLTFIIMVSLPLWKARPGQASAQPKITSDASTSADSSSPSTSSEPPTSAAPERALSLREVLRIPGAKEILVCFFFYCAVEQTSMLWASSYLKLWRGLDGKTAAQMASLFFIGITVGRGLSGFVTMKLNDTQMIRLGEIILCVGLAIVMIPGPLWLAFAGLILAGLGCAPIYPCIIHSTPAHFGAKNSQAVIGVQMATAYMGSLAMPPIFGVVARHTSFAIMPFWLFAATVIMALMHEALVRRAPMHSKLETA